MADIPSTDLQPKRFQDFVNYSDGLTKGDSYREEKKIINENGSYFTPFTRVYQMYDKSPEDKSRVLVGQKFVDYLTIYDNKNNISATMGNQVHFFKNGSIKVEFSTYNYTLGTPIVATIVYGTGEYLGAQGFLIIDNTQVQTDACGSFLSEFKDTFKFTN